LDPKRFRRVEALFHAALDRAPEQRDAYLADACAGDEALRAQVERLLAADAADGVVTAAVDQATFGAATANAEAQIGRQVGPWRIVRALGAGGMGTVFLAERVDGAYQASAALKMLNPWLLGSDFERRFAQERQILAELNHAAIAHLLDGGVTAEGVPWLALEYVDGVEITRYVGERRLGLDARIGMLLEVCEAVQHAHQKLVVHRDLKPGNILVDRDGRPKLLDFGIAKILASDPGRSITRAEAETRMLTPGYASPEQLRGESVTTASDVYALAVILYEMVTGQRPGTPEEVLKPGWQPTRPSSLLTRAYARGELAIPGDVARWKKRLKGDLDTVVLKALATDPKRRYATVREFAEDLRAIAASRPITARPDAFGYRLKLFLRRNRVVVAFSAVMLGLIVASAVALALLALRLRDERDRATAAQLRAEQAARTAERTSGFLAGLFQSSDPRNKGGALTARELLDAGSRRLETELADEPETLAYLSFVIGAIQRQLGLLDDAERSVARSLALRRERLGTGHRETADAMSELGDILRMQSRYAESEALQRESLAIREQLEPPDPIGVGQSLNNLALVIKESGRPRDALSLNRRALGVRLDSLGRQHPLTIVTLINLGMLERELGLYADAERHLREVLELRLAQHGEQHVSSANALTQMGRLYDSLGRYDDAEAMFRRALAAAQASVDPDHPAIATGYADLGRIREVKSDWAGAERAYREELAIDARNLAPSHHNVLLTEARLGYVRAQQGDVEAGMRAMRTALDGLRRSLPEDHPRVARVQFDLGRLLLANDRAAEAVPLLEAALATRRARLGESHAETAFALREVAMARRALGATDAAQRDELAAQAMLFRALPPGHPERPATAGTGWE
jgi:serine/threonine-protein kinase